MVIYKSYFTVDSEKVFTHNKEFNKQLKKLFGKLNKSQKEFVSLLYEAAVRDEKTGLYNSKFFDTILEMEMEKAKRGNQKLSLFAIDIDFFKKLNDSHGHLKGDEVLVDLAGLLQKQMRLSDVVSRFGGEEFFILLPETSVTKAKKITSRLRSAIKKEKLLKKYGVTVSGGLTGYKEGDTKASFMERADKALYKAKQTGRDKFVAIE
jgi:diguanylate cyclase (GGDEF)-like protein